jgi:ABC-type phosphate transport system permease subunit
MVSQVGMRNAILGTFLLMGLTVALALPIGVAVGIYLHEYAGKKLGGIIRFSTTALRSISGIIVAIFAINLLRGVGQDTFLDHIIHGFGHNVDGVLTVGRSSFLFASAFIALLVIPLIARATEEGLSSLPPDIQEGSLGVGASKEYTLTHILLPWSLPNIITGLVLGCAEAAGALTIIFLIAGTGEYGVSPWNEVTSLSYLIFDCRFGSDMGDQVQRMMGSYQYTAALLLLVITVGLTIAAMTLKNITARRYKGI